MRDLHIETVWNRIAVPHLTLLHLLAALLGLVIRLAVLYPAAAFLDFGDILAEPHLRRLAHLRLAGEVPRACTDWQACNR